MTTQSRRFTRTTSLSDDREAAIIESLRAMYAQQHYTDEGGGAESALWYWLDELQELIDVILFDQDNPELWLRED
jgi:hypothetical protein